MPVKISDLPAATAFAGTETFPVVQTSTTKKGTISQIADYVKAFFSADDGSSLVGFINTGAGAQATTLQARGRERVYASDYDTLQHAINAAAGKTLDGAGRTYTVTAALTLPSDIVIERLNIAGNVATGNTLTATSVSNIIFRDCNITSAGTYSSVLTFVLCSQVLFERCIINSKVGSALGSVGIRSQGTTFLTIDKCQFYDADSMVYLDLSGGTLSDHVIVRDSLFKHTFLGATNNPQGIYQFNCYNLLVDGCTFIDIAAGGGAPIAGYSVYDGDGTTRTLVVTNCITTMSSVKAHVMVQNSIAPSCIVTNNRFRAPDMQASGLTNFLVNSAAPLGSLNVENNYMQQATIFVAGSASATPTRAAYIHGNQIIKAGQATSGIRLGVAGANYVGFASVKNNTIYCTVGGSIDMSQCTYAVIENNQCMNWNVADNATHTLYAYTAGLYIEGSAQTAVLRGNKFFNDGTIPGDTGYCRVAIALDNISVTVISIDNNIGSMLDSRTVKCTEGGYSEDGVFKIAPQTAIPTLSEPNQIAFSYDDTGTGTLTIYVRNNANTTTHSANIALT